MNLQERIGLISVLATVAIMYAAITSLLPLVSILPSLKFFIVILSSAVIYRIIGKGIYSLLGKFLRLRKMLLGEEFLEGTWVGRIRREPTEYTIERYRQNMGILEIEGDSFLEDGKPRSHWQSTAVRIDLSNRKLVYSYNCNIEGKTQSHEGVASFQLKWENEKLTACDHLEGYAADLTDGARDANSEYKLSDQWLGREKALEQAKKYFLNK